MPATHPDCDVNGEFDIQVCMCRRGLWAGGIDGEAISIQVVRMATRLDEIAWGVSVDYIEKTSEA